MEIFKLVGNIFVDNEKANKNLDKTDSRAEKVGKTFQKTAKNVGKFAKIASGVGVVGLIGLTKGSVDLAQAQERAEARLESMGKTVAGANDEQLKALKTMAALTQQTTTFGDEVLIAGQSQLLSFGVSTDQTEMLTGSMADLLAATKGVNATQEDAVNAANLMGKAFNGQAGALSKAGILLNDAQAEILKTGTASEKTAALVEIMDANMGGLANTLAGTTEGQIVQIKNTMGDLGETIGFKVLPIFNKFLNWVQENMPVIETVATNTFNFISKATEALIKVITEVFIPALQAIWDWIEPNLPLIQEMFTIAFDAIMNLLSDVWSFIQDNLLPILVGLFDWVLQNMPIFQSIFKTAFDTIKTVIDAVWSILEVTLFPLLKTLFKWVSDNMPLFQAIFETAFGAIDTAVQFTQGVINGIIDTIEGMIDAIKRGLEFLSDFNDAEKPGMSQGKAADSGVDPEFRAEGGPISAGKPYIVGEVGPELIIPRNSGTVIPNNQLAAGSTGGVNIVINADTIVGDDDALWERLVERLRELGIGQ